MLVVTIWPIFAIICVGFVLKRAGFPGVGFWPAAERINYFLLFPALLFSSLAGAPVDDPGLLRLGGSILTVILVAAFAFALVRRFRSMPAARFGPALQSVIRFNVYLFLAITATIAPDGGLERAAVVLAVAVPTVNVLSVIALTEPSERRSFAALLRPIAKNPLILACLSGIVVAFVGTGLPFGIDRFLSLIAQASLPLGLLCVGAALKPASLGQDVQPLALNGFLRLFAMPVLAFAVAAITGLGAIETLVLVVFTAVPTAPTAYVLTQQLRGDGPLMAGLITSQTVASVATIPIVLALLIGA